MKKLLTILTICLFLIMLLLFLSGNPLGNRNFNTNKLQVTTSFYPLYFFAGSIGGNRVQVTNITPAGAEPHDYEPTPQDLVAIAKSKLLILNGGNLEPWGSKIAGELQETGVTIIVAGEGLTTGKIQENGGSISDPHVWLSPELAGQEIARILAGFIKVDPANEVVYRMNAEDLLTRLNKLDNDFRFGLAQCQSHNIITAHNAFNYLANAFGLTQTPITGLSPDSEPSTQQLTELAKFAKDNKVKYIFFESLVSPKLAETLAGEIGAQTLVLDPLEGISRERLANGENYFSVMRQNLSNLRQALACK